jgi:predicted nucleic acid-binding protein
MILLDASTIVDALRATPEAIWDKVGDVLAQLRGGGVTVPLADALLCALALELGVEVWARDSDFRNMQRILPTLKLYREKP